MAEAWGQILRAIGAFLNGIYELIPSYGLAIVILTILVRLVLFSGPPLDERQIALDGQHFMPEAPCPWFCRTLQPASDDLVSP